MAHCPPTPPSTHTPTPGSANTSLFFFFLREKAQEPSSLIGFLRTRRPHAGRNLKPLGRCCFSRRPLTSTLVAPSPARAATRREILAAAAALVSPLRIEIVQLLSAAREIDGKLSCSLMQQRTASAASPAPRLTLLYQPKCAQIDY